MALTTLTKLKTHLGVSGTTQDAFLTQLLSAAEAALLKLIDRQIEEDDLVCYLSGNDRRVLVLPEYPVASVSEVKLDPNGFWGTAPSSFGASTVLTSGTDYALVLDGADSQAGVGRLYKIGGVWPGRFEARAGLLTARSVPGMGNVKVSYRAGYATVPADLELCLWQSCAILRQARTSGMPNRSERFEEYSYDRLVEDLSQTMLRPGSIQSTLARYKRITPRYRPLL